MPKKKKARPKKRIKITQKSNVKRKTRKSVRARRGGNVQRIRTVTDKPGWMGIEGVHLAFTTKEPHATLNFYRDTLGFVNVGSTRARGTLKPGFSRNDEGRGILRLQATRDTAMEFQDYSLAYHWVAQLGGRPPEEPLSGQIYLIVRDVDRVYDRLSKKGVEFFSAPREMPWGHRIIECADPEGRRVIFAEISKKKK